MKKSFSYLLFLVQCFFLQSLQMSAQVPIEQFYLPYHDDPSGPFHIKTYVNFVVAPPPAAPWISAPNAETRAAQVVDYLNSIYNKYNIFFHPGEGCENNENKIFEYDFGSSQANVSLLRAANPNSVHDGLDIYILDEDAGGAQGVAYDVPNTFCHIEGKEADGTPAGLSSVLVHEVGHCLGLSHTFTSHITYPGSSSTACNQTVSGCFDNSQQACDCPPGVSPGYCCGDYVEDTPINNSVEQITAGNDCQPINQGIDPLLVLNFMSYVEPRTCRIEFTPDQAKRMRVYLENSITLDPIKIKDISIPGGTPSNPSGNIIVESGEFVVSATLEMLPDAVIRVKRGATLKVQSTITGACGQLWRGIIVEGTQQDLTQSLANQGEVIVPNSGKIEHARCAVDLQDYDADGPLSGSGGGRVRAILGQFENNIIGIRFGPYIGTSNNKSYFFSPRFSTTSGYRGGNARPVFMELNTVKGISVPLGIFKDLRPACDDVISRTIGIDARDAGLRVSLSTQFENLYCGIRADKLSELGGSLYVSGSIFKKCYKGVEVISSGSFTIYNNDFTIKSPDFCPVAPEIKGVEIRGNTTGFDLSDNQFSFDGEDAPVETIIGTDCIESKDGMNNLVFHNNYSNTTFSNRAIGYNGYDEDGLLYLCNINQNYQGIPTDLFVGSGSIRKIQGRIVSGQPISPTGNKFSSDPSIACTIVNQGEVIDYYFFDGDPAQDPGDINDPGNVCIIGGFIDFPLNDPNDECEASEPPCFPCPEVDVSAWKTNFYQNRQQWLIKTAAYPSITDPAQQMATADTIRRLRIAMNEDGSRILKQYNLDSINVATDSAVSWLTNIETYPASLRLVSHYFFTGNYPAFNDLREQIPEKYGLDENELDEYERLGALYDTLYLQLQSGHRIDNLSDSVVETLKLWAANCDEPGFLSGSILWRNGIDLGPDCNSEAYRQHTSTATDLVDLDKGIYVYPNPATGVISISYPGISSSGFARLYDAHGKIVRVIRLHEYSYKTSTSVDDLASGVYFALICIGDHVPQFRKIIVSR